MVKWNILSLFIALIIFELCIVDIEGTWCGGDKQKNREDLPLKKKDDKINNPKPIQININNKKNNNKNNNNNNDFINWWTSLFDNKNNQKDKKGQSDIKGQNDKKDQNDKKNQKENVKESSLSSNKSMKKQNINWWPFGGQNNKKSEEKSHEVSKKPSEIEMQEIHRPEENKEDKKENKILSREVDMKNVQNQESSNGLIQSNSDRNVLNTLSSHEVANVVPSKELEHPSDQEKSQSHIVQSPEVRPKLVGSASIGRSVKISNSQTKQVLPKLKKSTSFGRIEESLNSFKHVGNIDESGEQFPTAKEMINRLNTKQPSWKASKIESQISQSPEGPQKLTESPSIGRNVEKLNSINHNDNIEKSNEKFPTAKEMINRLNTKQPSWKASTVGRSNSNNSIGNKDESQEKIPTVKEMINRLNSDKQSPWKASKIEPQITQSIRASPKLTESASVGRNPGSLNSNNQEKVEESSERIPTVKEMINRMNTKQGPWKASSPSNKQNSFKSNNVRKISNSIALKAQSLSQKLPTMTLAAHKSASSFSDKKPVNHMENIQSSTVSASQKLTSNGPPMPPPAPPKIPSTATASSKTPPTPPAPPKTPPMPPAPPKASPKTPPTPPAPPKTPSTLPTPPAPPKTPPTPPKLPTTSPSSIKSANNQISFSPSPQSPKSVQKRQTSTENYSPSSRSTIEYSSFPSVKDRASQFSSALGNILATKQQSQQPTQRTFSSKSTKEATHETKNTISSSLSIQLPSSGSEFRLTSPGVQLETSGSINIHSPNKKEPEERFPTVKEMAKRLSSQQSSRLPKQTPPPPPKLPSKISQIVPMKSSDSAQSSSNTAQMSTSGTSPQPSIQSTSGSIDYSPRPSVKERARQMQALVKGGSIVFSQNR